MALLQQHGSLEELLKHAVEVKPKKAAASLSSGALSCFCRLQLWKQLSAGSSVQHSLLAVSTVAVSKQQHSCACPHRLSCWPPCAAEGRAAAHLSQRLVRIETDLDLPPVREPLENLR
jgi:hypothetical protein